MNDSKNVGQNQIENLETEFRYYSLLLRRLFPFIKQQKEKEIAITWIKKLHNPECSVSIIKDKRNRYMLMLCITLLTNKLDGIFQQEAPQDILPELNQLEQPEIRPFQWEHDNSWDEYLKQIDDVDKNTGHPKNKKKCMIHAGGACPVESEIDILIGNILDKQFRFYLFIAKPYAALLQRIDRIYSAKWLQSLCLIRKTSCAVSKGIRNDYMMALLSCLASGTLYGPFLEYPTSIILPLCNVARKCAKGKPLTDPTHPMCEKFLEDLPFPDEGAFAFISLTGDLYDAATN